MLARLNTKWRKENTYDAIVVGSGMTGGYAAMELTRAGLKTLVLERGRMVRHVADYPTAMMDPWDQKYPGGNLPEAEIKAHYPTQNRTGYILTESTQHFLIKDDENPYTQDKPFDWIRGYQVGGRSLLWARQTYRHSPLDFGANARDGSAPPWPVTYEEIAPWYDRVERFIGVSGQKEGLAQLPDGVFQPPMEMNVVEQAFKAKLADKLGRRVTIGRCAHLTEPTQEQLALGRGKCQHRNLCARGCPFGAYYSANSTSLVAAEKTGHLKIRPHSVVTTLIHDPKTGKASGVRIFDTTTKQEEEFYAKVIFLCASNLNSAWIMLNSTSRRFPNGFGNGSDQVGRNVIDHLYNVAVQGSFEGHLDSYYSGRRPNGIYIPRFRNLGDKASHRSDYLRGFAYQAGASRPTWDRGLALPGIGADFKAKLKDPGPWLMRLGGAGEMLPYADNRVTLNHDLKDENGLPTLRMDVSLRENEIAMTKDIKAAGAEMLEAAGAKDIKIIDRVYSPGLGIHEMGAARMGADPKTSVLNAHNAMHECKNVYVTDGAFMASAACVNPSLTYLAFTSRAAAHAVDAARRGDI